MLCDIVPTFNSLGVNRNGKQEHHPSDIGVEKGSLGTQNILIVDDQEESLEILGDQLRAAGWQVMLATNGKDALEKVETYRPRVIVLDMVMPEMDGFQVATLVKKNPNYQNIHVVAATSLCSPGDRERCLAAGLR